MRLTIKDIVKHPSWFVITGWWMDTPWKRPTNWLTLLFRDGRGWLRWGFSSYSYTEPIPGHYGRGPSFIATCAPPARRAWIELVGLLAWRQRGFSKGLKDPEWPHGFLLS